MFKNDEDENYILNKYIYFTSKQKFINYGDGEGSLNVQKEDSIPLGAKNECLSKKPKFLMKIEFHTL